MFVRYNQDKRSALSHKNKVANVAQRKSHIEWLHTLHCRCKKKKNEKIEQEEILLKKNSLTKKKCLNKCLTYIHLRGYRKQQIVFVIHAHKAELTV